MFKSADVPVSFLEVFFINRLIRTKIFSTEKANLAILLC